MSDVDSDEQMSERDEEEDQDQEDGLGQVHKLFLQAVMSRRVVSQSVAEYIHSKACALLESAFFAS